MGVPGSYNGAKAFSAETARNIDEEVLKIPDESHVEARRLLGQNRAALDALINTLAWSKRR